MIFLEKIISRFAVLFLLFSVVSCASAQRVERGGYSLMLKTLLDHDVPEVDVKDAVKLVDSALFLDTREVKEYEVSHIKNALHVGYDNFDSTKVMDLPRDSKIVVYCSVGYRSEKITERLFAYGFSDVANLYGGMFEWVNQGNPVYNDAGKTEKVHAFDRVWGVWLRKGEKVY